MKNRTFIIIMTILGFIIIGSCALGIYSYHEMSQMDENAKMQTYITNLTGADLAKQKAEDEAELLRIEKERELALAEEEKKCIERENATKEKESEAMDEGNEAYDDRPNYSSDENRSSQDTNPYLKYWNELVEHTNEYRSGAWRGNPMQLVFVQRAILQDYDNLINLASYLGDERRYNGFMRAKEVQMAQFRAASY